jgi:hypothetical protein
MGSKDRGRSQMKSFGKKEFGPDNHRDGVGKNELLRFCVMFTGIVETQGIIKKVIEKRDQ